MKRDTSVKGNRAVALAAMLLVGLALPGRAGNRSAATGEASDIGWNSALLHGVVNSGGGLGNVYFFWYGTQANDLAGGKKTLELSLGNSIADQPVDARIFELQPDTLYYYTVMVYNPGAAVVQLQDTPTRGAMRTFRTLPAPKPVVSTGEVDAVRSDRATLHGTVDGNGLPARYLFEWGKITPGESTGPVQAVTWTGPGPVALTVTGLEDDTLYRYHLRAMSAAGGSMGVRREFRTAKRPPPVAINAGETVPRIPVNLKATARSQYQVTLSWRIDIHAGGSTPKSYVVERKGPGGTFAQTAQVPAAVNSGLGWPTTWSDSGLAAGSAYVYRVKSINGSQVSAWSAELSVTTLALTSLVAVQPTKPGAPQRLAAKLLTPSRVGLEWVQPQGGPLVAALKSFLVEVKGLSPDNQFSQVMSVPVPAGQTGGKFGAEYLNPYLTKGKSYTFRVRAATAAGASEPSNEAVVAIPAGSIPSGKRL